MLFITYFARFKARELEPGTAGHTSDALMMNLASCETDTLPVFHVPHRCICCGLKLCICEQCHLLSAGSTGCVAQTYSITSFRVIE